MGESDVHAETRRHRVVAYDYGIKQNILRLLVDHHCEVYVVPAQTSAEDVLEMKPDGVFLSNGPGDPEPVTYAVENIQKLVGRVPVFGICLGHQLCGLALGGKTFKLKFGHHGSNHPVKNLLTEQVEITAQNHGFCVAARFTLLVHPVHGHDEGIRAAGQFPALRKAHGRICRSGKT